MQYLPKITNEEVSALSTHHFKGEIVVVDSTESMLRAEEILSHESVIGFDTETRPSFTKGVHYNVSLLQLSTKKCALLFRLQLVPLSPKILEILANPSVLKIGAAIRDDIRILRAAQDFTPGGFIDLQTIIGKWGIEELSVRKMAAIVLAIRVSKAQRLSNWEATTLTPSQREYAAMDAWVCREIYQCLNP